MANNIGAGIAIGVSTAAPKMNELNNQQNIAAFAQAFKARYGNDKSRAMAEYKFGSLVDGDHVALGGADNKAKYLADVAAVGAKVKNLWVKTLVDNYFDANPKPVDFSIGSTLRVGGDLRVGTIADIDGNESLSVRILCHIPQPDE